MKCFICLIVIVLQIVFVTMDRCLINSPVIHHKRFIFYEGKSIDLVIEVSDRVTHRILTEIFRIYINETLGYQKVQVVSFTDSMNVTNRLETLAGSYWLAGNTIPKAMINLEVWLTADTDVKTTHYYDNVIDYGVVSPPGRFAWFIPKLLGNMAETFDSHWTKKSDDILWTIFQQKTSFNVFDISHPNDLELIEIYTFNQKTNKRYCNHTECNDKGIFIPNQCKSESISCALLLAGDYHMTNFVIDQIKDLNLYVKVAWFGHNLKPVLDTLIKRYQDRNLSNRSIVFLTYMPSDLTIAENDYYTVLFPHCEKSNLNFTLRYGCRYEMIRLVKMGWKKLAQYAEPIHDALTQFNFDLSMYRELIYDYKREYEKTGDFDLSIRNVACQWIREHPGILYTRHPHKAPIYIGGIFPLSGVFYDARVLINAARLATEAIRENNSILEHHDLNLLVHNGKCQSDVVLKRFIDFMRNSLHDSLLGVLGPACSDTAEPVAGISKHYHTLVISYSAEGASFSNRQKYPYFFRTIGENKHYTLVYFEFFKTMGWSRVASLNEDGKKYTEYISHMNDVSEKWNIQFIANKKFLRDRDHSVIRRALEDLKRKRARIIIADIEDVAARSVMCEAYRLKMTAKDGYVWFLPLWLATNWYNTTYYNAVYNETVNCTLPMMIEAANGYFSLSYAFFGPDDSIMQENITVKQWKDKLLKMSTSKGSDHPGSLMNYAGYVYDAVWVYALAADKLIKDDPEVLSNLHSESTVNKLVEIVKNTDFIGVSGRMRFNGGPSRFSNMNIHQWINTTSTLIGTYYPNVSNTLPEIIGGTLDLKRKKIVWLYENGTIPGDGKEPPVKCFFGGIAKLLNVTCDMALIIVNFVIFIFFSIILSGAIYLVKQRYSKIASTHKYMISIGIDLLAENQLASLRDWELPEDRVILNRTLGQGSFGIVYGGELRGTEKGNISIAVKTLKPEATIHEKLNFLAEAEIMKKFDHRNILKLIGVVSKSATVKIVFEFMLNGNLRNFLLSRRCVILDESKKGTPEADDVSNKRLTMMALDVARALSYLAMMKYVHRDVACRNCLVNSNKLIKLGDFGMTRMMMESDCYTFQRNDMLPVRWLAPESLGLGIFTPATDVWSFGVLLYEIVTMGSFPYRGLSNAQVLEHVKCGNTAHVPDGVNNKLSQLIYNCWSLDPKKRPSAAEIAVYLANNPDIVNACPNESEPSMELENGFKAEYHVPPNQIPIQEKVHRCSLALSLLTRPLFHFNTTPSNLKNSKKSNNKQKLPPPIPPKNFVDSENIPFLQDPFTVHDSTTIETLVMTKRAPPTPPDSQLLVQFPLNGVQSSNTPPAPGPKQQTDQDPFQPQSPPPHAIPEDD